MPTRPSRMVTPLPDDLRTYVAKRVGSWPKVGDINYPVAEAVDAVADYIDLIAARVFGERLD